MSEREEHSRSRRAAVLRLPLVRGPVYLIFLILTMGIVFASDGMG